MGAGGVGATGFAGAGGVTVLAVEGLSKSFGGVAAVREVGFAVAAGEMLALIGPNGAGKARVSTWWGAVASGSGGGAAGGAGDHGVGAAGDLAAGGGADVPGDGDVREHDGFGERADGVDFGSGGGGPGLGGGAGGCGGGGGGVAGAGGVRGQAGAGGGGVGVWGFEAAGVAIALANGPRLLLMDEPTAGMAPGERTSLMELTRRLASARGLAVLFTEHDMDVVFAVSDRIIVLNRGEVIAAGAPGVIRADARVREVYLGSGATSGGH